MSNKVIYSRGFPYGAPLVMLRGGGLKAEGVKDFLREQGFRWSGGSYAYEHYLDRTDLGPILVTLRDEFGCDILPKDNMDESYILDLSHPQFSRPGTEAQ